MNGPAFALGNGPTLPADPSPLAGQITIGVNRILESGFTPTAVAWCDREVWEEQRHLLENGDAMLLTTISNYPRHHKPHHILKLRRSDHDKGNPADFCASGSTGTAAARLLLALGFDPVYCLGMGGEYDEDGRTDFWGTNARHNSKARETFAREMEKLQRYYGHHVYRTDDPAVWKLAPPRTQEEWREWLDKELRRAGVEVMSP